MAVERDSMTLKGLSAPALGVEERSDEAPDAGASAPPARPDPEVLAKPKRRRFTAEYRLRILEEADRCTEPGEVGRLLRREGLYSSHLTAWRRARRNGALRGLTSKKRGAKPKARNPLEPKVRELEAKVARLEKELHKAHTILDVQEKVAGLLGFSLDDGKDS
jgi:transposase-like protein